MLQFLTPHQSQYFAWQLTRQAESGSVAALASTLVDAQVDLNPHQVDAALFACRNSLSKGVILADEVGLGKTIEAGLVILQRWAERKRRMLIVVPANLRKQWHQELQDKFGLQALILEAKSYNTLRKQGRGNPFEHPGGPVICSYQFAKAKADDLKRLAWDLVVLDEAHRLRNVYKKGNVIAKTLKDALAHVPAKVLLTATPLQNTLLELYGLVNTASGQALHPEDAEKLLRLPATAASIPAPAATAALTEALQTRRQALLTETQQRNLGHFEQEVQKLDDWADDLKLGLEEAIKETDRQIKEVRRSATHAATLEEKLHWQKQQRQLEAQRSKQRRELFERQDEIEAQRNRLIEGLEGQLQQRVEEEELFLIEWILI